MDKSKGDGLTQRREGGDPGRIGEMRAQTDRKGEVGGSSPAFIPHPHPAPSKSKRRGLWHPGLHLPLRGRGMSSGSLGVRRLTGGWPAVGTAGEWRRGWRWVRRGLRVSPRPSREPQPRRSRGLASPIHLTRAGFRARWPKSELLAKSSFFGP